MLFIAFVITYHMRLLECYNKLGDRYFVITIKGIHTRKLVFVITSKKWTSVQLKIRKFQISYP